VAIRDIRMQELTEIKAGGLFHVEADISMGALSPDDVIVEAYCGRLDPSDQFVDRFTHTMHSTGMSGDRVFNYQCDVPFEDAGHYGLNIRVTPNHPNPESRHAMGLVVWGES